MNTMLNTIKWVLTLLTVLLISGCTTLSEDVKDVEALRGAGISKVVVKTILAEPPKVAVGTDYTAILGKEYKSFYLKVKFTGKVPEITIKALGVGAFEGQATAQAALVKAREALTIQNVEQTNIGASVALEAIDAALKAMNPISIPIPTLVP